MNRTLLIALLLVLVLLIMIGSVVLVHYAETRKIRKRLGKSQAHPDSVVLMEHITNEQERTRGHISNQLATKSNDASTTKGVVIDIRSRLEALIKTLNDFVRGVK